MPPAWFGTASGVLNMARQVGTVLGVASLIGVLSTVSTGSSMTTYRHGVALVIGFFALAGVTSAALLSRRVTTSAS